MSCDKGRVVEVNIQKTKGLIICAEGYSQRELGLRPESSKGRYRGGHYSVGAERRAAMDVCCNIIRRQAGKRYVDVDRLGCCIKHHLYRAGPRRGVGRHLICARKISKEVCHVSMGDWHRQH